MKLIKHKITWSEKVRTHFRCARASRQKERGSARIELASAGSKPAMLPLYHDPRTDSTWAISNQIDEPLSDTLAKQRSRVLRSDRSITSREKVDTTVENLLIVRSSYMHRKSETLFNLLPCLHVSHCVYEVSLSNFFTLTFSLFA